MILLFILIAVWVLIETWLFFLQKSNVLETDNEISTEYEEDSDSDETFSESSNNKSSTPESSNDSGAHVTTSSEEYETDLMLLDYSHESRHSKTVNKLSTDKSKKITNEKCKQLVHSEILARQELDYKQIEEYLRSKQFNRGKTIEDGYETDSNATDTDTVNMLYKFVQHIRYNKIIALDVLAKEYKLKVPDVVAQIQELQKIGILSGVIDDRGNFIYVSEKEIKAVTKFIQQQRMHSWPQTALI